MTFIISHQNAAHGVRMFNPCRDGTVARQRKGDIARRAVERKFAVAAIRFVGIPYLRGTRTATRPREVDYLAIKFWICGIVQRQEIVGTTTRFENAITAKGDRAGVFNVNDGVAHVIQIVPVAVGDLIPLEKDIGAGTDFQRTG